MLKLLAAENREIAERISLNSLGSLWLIIFSAFGYWIAGFRLESAPGREGVYKFLILFGALFLLYAISLWSLSSILKNVSRKHAATAIIAVAAMFRLLTIPAGMSDGVSFEKIKEDLTGRAVVFDRFLLYDHDVWRFLWDGRQQSVGLNPYAYAPAELEPYSEKTSELGIDDRLFPTDAWRDIWDNINYKEVRTIYPPLLQWLFRLSHFISPGSVIVWKLLLLAIDLCLCSTLAALLLELKLPVHYLAAYAWNPLVIKETAGSAHPDVLPALFIVLALLAFARGRTGWGTSWLALGILAKLTPIILVPLALRRMSIKDRAIGIILLLLGFIPFAGVSKNVLDGLSTFSREWIFNPGVFELFRWLSLQAAPAVNPTATAKVICGALFFGLIIRLWRSADERTEDLAKKWLTALGGLLFLSSAVMPWYLIWLLPLAALCRRSSWLLYSGLCMLSYWVYIRGDGQEETWRLAVIHGGFVLTYIFEEMKSRNDFRRRECKER